MELKHLDPALRLAVGRVAWGAARPFVNVQLVVRFTRNPAEAAHVLELNVRVSPNKRPLLLGDQVERIITTPPGGVSVSSRIAVTDRELEYGNGSPEVIALQALQRAVLSASARLYEADPRIGTCDQRYHHVPLFDPPNGLDAMRRIPGCSLCGTSAPDPGGAGYRAWGGGNIGWVHPTCLADVYR